MSPVSNMARRVSGGAENNLPSAHFAPLIQIKLSFHFAQKQTPAHLEGKAGVAP
jgi:hypothetical protein